MNRAGTITRSSLVLAGIVIGAVGAWACSSAGTGGSGGSSLVPDANAAGDPPCKTWKVKNFALGDTQNVNEYELPDGYEPINGDADYYKLLTVIGKKCVAY